MIFFRLNSFLFNVVTCTTKHAVLEAKIIIIKGKLQCKCDC